MKNRITFTSMLVAFALLAGLSPAMAGSAWTDYDAASPLIIRYVGAETIHTLQVTATTIVQITDTTTTTTTYNGFTLAQVVAALAAAEDDEGDKEWEVIYWAGIAADAVASNDLIVAAATSVGREWNTVVKWDISNEKHYDCVVSHMVGNDVVGSQKIMDVFGEPTGTGDATVSIYVDGVRKYYKTITSPVYVYGVGYATNVADNSIDLADYVDLGDGVDVGKASIGFVRVARASTATTGGIGVNVSE